MTLISLRLTQINILRWGWGEPSLPTAWMPGQQEGPWGDCCGVGAQ